MRHSSPQRSGRSRRISQTQRMLFKFRSPQRISQKHWLGPSPCGRPCLGTVFMPSSLAMSQIYTGITMRRTENPWVHRNSGTCRLMSRKSVCIVIYDAQPNNLQVCRNLPQHLRRSVVRSQLISRRSHLPGFRYGHASRP
jgi:hypothetical protein